MSPASPRARPAAPPLSIATVLTEGFITGIIERDGSDRQRLVHEDRHRRGLTSGPAQLQGTWAIDGGARKSPLR